LQDTAPLPFAAGEQSAGEQSSKGEQPSNKKRRRFDPRDLWHAYALDRLVQDAWQRAVEPGDEVEQVDSGLNLWLDPHERAHLELEARFLSILEAMPAYRDLASDAWRSSRAGEANAFAARFARIHKDKQLTRWLTDNKAELRRRACAAVERDYQREHDTRRYWLRDFKASGAYDKLVTERIAAWRRSIADGTVPEELLQTYRSAMTQRLADLNDDFKRTLHDARQATTKLRLHAQLVVQFPPEYDALALLGGSQAYLERLAEDLTCRAANDEFLLNTHGKLGFARASETGVDVARRVVGDEGAWRRSVVRSLRRKAQKKLKGNKKAVYDDFTERVYLDLLDASADLHQLGSSSISRAVYSYVTTQLLAASMPDLEAKLVKLFDAGAYTAALCSSPRPDLRRLGASFTAHEESERARRAALRRAYAEAAASANADPYLAYPARRTHPRAAVIHVGPTNAGKTHDALETFTHAERAVYLGPLRLLAAEAADATNERGLPCSLVTGEERRLVEGATHVASTVEMFDPRVSWDVAVVDEAQMVGDLDRGGAWSRALIGLDADELHICCAPEGLDIVRRILDGCGERFGDTYRVQRHERLNPLLASPELVRFPEEVRPGDACIVFSKRDVHAAAAELHEAGRSCCVVYGALPYAVRRAEARRFRSGEAEVVVATDAIGMGLNLPVKRVVFLRHDKYDGHEQREITAAEVKQIAGRAGRYGYAEAGEVASAVDASFIGESLEAEVKPVRHATLSFPRALLDVDAPVSVLFDAWSDACAPAPFRCADYSEEAMLAERAEHITDDAQTIYAFATLPFKSRDERVTDFWQTILQAHVAQKPLPEFDKGWLPDDLDSMQVVYDKLDLLSAYLMGPGSGHPTAAGIDLADVALLRDEVSADISDFLARQTYETRRCSDCGRPLSWGHRFGVCNRCAARRTKARREGRRGRR
jgi:ATP-dependent RNA helicase SUPV3L1/SUV3